tara:strand:+ start:44 stop:379 length:336 start_codon:yes stop_codon:yes gene_type:complete
MSNYNWCQGPECHTQETQSRVRGSAGNKVLRTIKIKHNSNYRSHERYQMFNYFCGNNCLFDYLRLHLQSIIAIAPRREALETKIKDPVKETTTNNYGYTWTNTRIERVDNN